MAVWYTEEQERARRARWLLEQLDDPDDVDYCKAEARKLFELGLTDEETGKLITYDYWLETVAETVYATQCEHRSRYCGEMEG